MTKKDHRHWARDRKKIKQEKERSIFLKVVYYFLVVFFTGVTVYILIFSEFLKINRLIISGVEELDYEEVEREARSRIEGTFLRIIPKNNFLLVSRNGMKDDLVEKFKKIDTVSVKKEFPDSVEINITERDSLLIWCSGSDCYIIDDKGRAYTRADFESAEIRENNFVKIFDESARGISLQEEVLDKKYIDFVLKIKDELKTEAGIEIADEYRTRARLANEIIVRTSEDWEIYFNSALSLKKSIRILKTFLEQQVEEGKRNELKYVDLRSGNKVYYKNKSEEKKEEDTEETGDETTI